MQSLLAQVSKSNVLGMSILRQVSSPIYQVFILGTAILPQLCQIWKTNQNELADKSSYIVSIASMKMRLFELQDIDKEVKKLRSEGLLEDWEDIK